MHSTTPGLKALLILLLTPLLALQAGCASLVHGTTQQVHIQSIPSGADIHIDGSYLGTTPRVVELRRGASYSLLLEHPGYQPWDLDLERRLSTWAAANLLTGNLLGAALDGVDGAAFRLSPPGVTATLIPVRQAPPRSAVEVPASLAGSAATGLSSNPPSNPPGKPSGN